MPEGYLPILVMVGVAGAFAAIALSASALLGPRRHNPAKDSVIESGMLPFGDARRRFPSSSTSSPCSSSSSMSK